MRKGLLILLLFATAAVAQLQRIVFFDGANGTNCNLAASSDFINDLNKRRVTNSVYFVSDTTVLSIGFRLTAAGTAPATFQLMQTRPEFRETNTIQGTYLISANGTTEVLFQTNLSNTGNSPTYWHLDSFHNHNIVPMTNISVVWTAKTQ